MTAPQSYLDGRMNNLDALTSTGSKMLADRITEYWIDKGYSPQVWTERIGDKTFQVRSDLVNGLPRRLTATADQGQHS